MAKRKINVVLEGRFKNSGIYIHKDRLEICPMKLDKDDVISYELINKSEDFSVWQGALGMSLLGDAGIALGFGGKKEYLIAIEWKHYDTYRSDKSLILIDDRYYKAFIRGMF